MAIIAGIKITLDTVTYRHDGDEHALRESFKLLRKHGITDLFNDEAELSARAVDAAVKVENAGYFRNDLSLNNGDIIALWYRVRLDEITDEYYAELGRLNDLPYDAAAYKRNDHRFSNRKCGLRAKVLTRYPVKRV